AVRQGEVVEPDIEFAAAFDPAGFFHFGDGSHDPATYRNDDPPADQDRKSRLQVDAVAQFGVLGAHAIDQAGRQFGAGRDGILTGGGRRRRRILRREEPGGENDGDQWAYEHPQSPEPILAYLLNAAQSQKVAVVERREAGRRRLRAEFGAPPGGCYWTVHRRAGG